MAESLLRGRGFKTGLFTSPHFNSINERIRINGKPISEEQLSATFEKLEKEDETEYLRQKRWFAYLTLIAFQTFVEQKVDVVILEVGIGGQLCPTSQFPMGAPRVCCISALGYDHLEILGYTIQEIAAAKAGIFRQGATLITTWQEYPEAYQVLVKEAKHRGQLLTPSGELIDSTELEFPQNINAASAILAVRNLMRKMKHDTFFERLRKTSCSTEANLMKAATSTEKKAINSVRWPGRQQILEHKVKGRKIKIILDAAHTPESMKILSNWAAAKKEGKTLILMRSAKGREINSQMVHIAEIMKPDYFAGCPNIALSEDELDSNSTKEKFSHIFPAFLTESVEDQMQKQRENIAKALESAREYGLRTLEFDSINDCLENMPEEVKTVVITGSMYMVAAFFRLRPDAYF